MKWLMGMLDKGKKKHGFTLIELMIVFIIIAILAVAAIPTYTYFKDRAYKSEASASLGAIKTVEFAHYTKNKYFTADWEELGMTTGDFAHNRWFGAGCFGLFQSASDDFTAVCDGGRKIGGGGGTTKVGHIKVKLSNTSDILDATSQDIGKVDDWLVN